MVKFPLAARNGQGISLPYRNAEALGSARVSRAGERVLAIANFSANVDVPPGDVQTKFVSAGPRCNGREATARLSNQVAAATAPQRRHFKIEFAG
jgi:hypothetical protein